MREQINTAKKFLKGYIPNVLKNDYTHFKGVPLTEFSKEELIKIICMTTNQFYKATHR